MNEIQQLSQNSARLLSSSNIITSVFSVVKELIENALDAGATNIEVKLENHGLEKIEVRDNGVGIKQSDVPFVAKSHFTSKISSLVDMELLNTYGFRGEALSAICAVAGLSITTKTAVDDISMTYIFDKSGDMSSSKPSASPSGTVVIVSHLFNNIPVRKKYYKSERRKKEEIKKIEDLLVAYSCAQIEKRFAFFHNCNLIWNKTATTDLKATLIQVFGSSNVNNLEYRNKKYEEKMKVDAFLPKKLAPVCYISRATSDRTIVIINKRPVHIKEIDKLLQDTYCHCNDDDNAKNRYPVCFLSITVPPSQLDVNVDPNKLRVLLHNYEEILNLLSDFLQTIPSDQNFETQNAAASDANRKYVVPSNASALPKQNLPGQMLLKSSGMPQVMETESSFGSKATVLHHLEKGSTEFLPISSRYEKTQNLQKQHELFNVQRDKNLKIVKLNESQTKLPTYVPSEELCKKSTAEKDPKQLCDIFNVETSKSVGGFYPVLHQKKLPKYQIHPVKQLEKNTTDINPEVVDFFSISNKDSSVTSKMCQELITESSNTEKQSNASSLFVASSGASNCGHQDALHYQNAKNIPLPSGLFVSSDKTSKNVSFEKQPHSNQDWTHGKISNVMGDVLQPVSVLMPNQKKKRHSVSESLLKNQKKRKAATEKKIGLEPYTKPMTAFDFFCRDKRLEVAAQNPAYTSKEIACLLFEQWKTLPPEEKNMYMETVQKQDQKTSAGDQFSEQLIPIRSLSSGVWICHKNRNLVLVNTFRIRETLLFHRLLETYQFKANLLMEPITITPEALGDSESYNVLLSLCMKENGSDILNVYLTSNGFNIKFCTKQCTAQLVSLSPTIPSYGLQDLNEILHILKDNESMMTLQQCRPFKVVQYLQGEAVRIARQSLPVQRRDEFFDLLNQEQKYLGDISVCFHNKPFQHHLFNLNEAEQKESHTPDE